MNKMITVVALPVQEERVWNISSEQVPHMTLMVLDAGLANPARSIEYIAHAAKTLCPFGMSVNYRSALGDKNADVLYFQKNAWNTQNLEDFRSDLLKNQDIFVAYNQVEQFPEWIPHMTLGYPETPAKKDDEDYPISWVSFDRIAVWTGDYTGPEFRLSKESYNDVAMSDLRHYGVMGMHWGKRKERREAPRATGYSQRQQQEDHEAYGRAGSDRINERLSKGLTIDAARKAEVSYRRKRAALVIGGAYLTAMLVSNSSGISQRIANNYVGKKNAAAGAQAAAKLLADSKGIGRHKIVDLGFNAVTGTWG